MACSSRSPSPQAITAYQSFKKITGALAVGVDKLTYDQLLQDAAAQLLVYKDFAKDRMDSAIIDEYMLGLAGYKDAGALWAEQLSQAQYRAVAKGRIYLSSAGAQLAFHYNLPIREEQFMNGVLRSISEDGIQSVMTQASQSVHRGDSIFVSHYRK